MLRVHQPVWITLRTHTCQKRAGLAGGGDSETLLLNGGPRRAQHRGVWQLSKAYLPHFLHRNWSSTTPSSEEPLKRAPSAFSLPAFAAFSSQMLSPLRGSERKKCFYFVKNNINASNFSNISTKYVKHKIDNIWPNLLFKSLAAT